MKDVAIISTSIHAAPKVYDEWARQGDLIVAGDRNTPRDLQQYVHLLGGTYLPPTQQDADWPEISELIGWNCIQRRNIAVLHAYRHGYKYVVTVDDDNMPSPDWVAQHRRIIEGDYPANTQYLLGDDEWVDVGTLNVPHTRQRGTPWGVVQEHQLLDTLTINLPRCVVSTAMVLGNPDCDAVTRLVRSNPTITSISHSAVVDPGAWAAFNSQATIWDGRWAPFIACLPHVGRYDDIFASFIAKRVMMTHGVTFFAGEPTVTQERNAHDFVRDLREEVFGMQVTPYFVRALGRAPIDHRLPLPAAYLACAQNVHDLLPRQTVEFMYAWVKAWEQIDKENR